MKKTCTFLIMILSVILAGCAAYTSPQNYNFDKTKTINKSYDDVWAKLTQYFTLKGTPLKNIDKSNGFISTEYDFQDIPDVMDCGDGGIQTEPKATINILVVKKDDATNVTINVFYDCHLKYFGWTSGADNRVPCTSTGKFETELLDFISK